MILCAGVPASGEVEPLVQRESLQRGRIMTRKMENLRLARGGTKLVDYCIAAFPLSQLTHCYSYCIVQWQSDSTGPLEIRSAPTHGPTTNLL